MTSAMSQASAHGSLQPSVQSPARAVSDLHLKPVAVHRSAEHRSGESASRLLSRIYAAAGAGREPPKSAASARSCGHRQGTIMLKTMLSCAQGVHVSVCGACEPPKALRTAHRHHCTTHQLRLYCFLLPGARSVQRNLGLRLRALLGAQHGTHLPARHRQKRPSGLHHRCRAARVPRGHGHELQGPSHPGARHHDHPDGERCTVCGFGVHISACCPHALWARGLPLGSFCDVLSHLPCRT